MFNLDINFTLYIKKKPNVALVCDLQIDLLNERPENRKHFCSLTRTGKSALGGFRLTSFFAFDIKVWHDTVLQDQKPLAINWTIAVLIIFLPFFILRYIDVLSCATCISFQVFTMVFGSIVLY